MKRVICVLALAVISSADAHADLLIESLSWQRARVERGRIVSWEDSPALLNGPPKLKARLRARLTLHNSGSKPVEGILLRYSMTSHIAPVAGEKTEGYWGVPFAIEEKRVPKVGLKKTQDVYLMTSPAFDLHIAKLARAGWWPDRVKLQVMIEPHPGSVVLQSLESVLEVTR